MIHCCKSMGKEELEPSNKLDTEGVCCGQCQSRDIQQNKKRDQEENPRGVLISLGHTLLERRTQNESCGCWAPNSPNEGMTSHRCQAFQALA